MAVRPSVKIDLTPQGVAGALVIGQPLFDAINNMQNEVGRRSKLITKNGKQIIEECPAGDLDKLMTLQYIWEAPFPTDFDGFMAFMRKRDKSNPGSATELYNMIHEEVRKFRESDDSSPFQS